MSMRTPRGFSIILLVLALLAISVTVLAPVEAKKKPIKIGFLAPLTGGAAQIGRDMVNGFEMYLEETGHQIAAGETEYSPFGLRTMLAEGLVDYLIIDSTWAGGLTTWRKAAVMAELYQVPLAAHHDPQIHVHAVAASPTGFILESFADPTRDPLWFELFHERPNIADGFMTGT